MSLVPGVRLGAYEVIALIGAGGMGEGAYQTAAPARDVAVADSLVFVVVGNGEVLILRQTP